MINFGSCFGLQISSRFRGWVIESKKAKKMKFMPLPSFFSWPRGGGGVLPSDFRVSLHVRVLPVYIITGRERLI